MVAQQNGNAVNNVDSNSTVSAVNYTCKSKWTSAAYLTVASFIIQALIIILSLTPVFVFEYNPVYGLEEALSDDSSTGIDNATLEQLMAQFYADPSQETPVLNNAFSSSSISDRNIYTVFDVFSIKVAELKLSDSSYKLLFFRNSSSAYQYELMGVSSSDSSFISSLYFFDFVLVAAIIACIVYMACKIIRFNLNPEKPKKLHFGIDYSNYSCAPSVVLSICMLYVTLTFNSWFTEFLNVYAYPTMYVIIILTIVQIVFNRIAASKMQKLQK